MGADHWKLRVSLCDPFHVYVFVVSNKSSTPVSPTTGRPALKEVLTLASIANASDQPDVTDVA
jgi:hypothetical protein